MKPLLLALLLCAGCADVGCMTVGACPAPAPRRNAAALRCMKTDTAFYHAAPVAIIVADYHGALCDTLLARFPQNVTWR